MKKIISAVILCLLSLSLGAGNVRILYWNIQNGMWDGQGDNYERFVSYVRQVNPDICVWCEAQTRYVTDSNVKCDPVDRYLPDNWDMLALRYGHKYVYLASHAAEFPQVITSRYPIENVERLPGVLPDSVMTRGAGWAKVRIENEELNIVCLHTWPFKYGYNVPESEQKKSAAAGEGAAYRVTELKYVCNNTVLKDPDAAGHYWMMLGDFNAESHLDNFNYGKPDDFPDFAVHRYILGETPYFDLIGKTYPGEFHRSTLSKRRIDFIYVTQALLDRVKYADFQYEGFPDSYRDTRKGFKFCHPSDHFPAVVDIEF